MVDAGTAQLDAGPPHQQRQDDATPRQRRHTATRDEILDAARGLMLEVGLENVSLRAIARRSGFSPASLYTYFASRDNLLVALTEQSLANLRACLEAVSRDLPADERVVQYGLAYMRFGAENPADLAAILAYSAMSLSVAVDTSLGLGAAHLIGDTFREGVEAGIFPDGPLPTQAMAYSTWALVHGMTTLRNVDLSWVSDDIGADPASVLRAHVASLKSSDVKGRDVEDRDHKSREA